METHRRILAQLLKQPVQIQGSTDLTLHNLKFSGNAQRRKRKALLFHGTFLLGMNLALIGRYLQMPKRQPEYRSQREHEGFLTCLPLPTEKLKQTLQAAWNAWQPAADWPETETSRLVREKYSTNTWNRRR
jgi:lipoate-protein ligase A